MKLHLQVGEIIASVKDCTYSKREVRELLKLMSSIHLAILESSSETPEPPNNPIGFAAHIERAPDAGPDYSEWFEDEE
jgi:hypothetical protein